METDIREEWIQKEPNIWIAKSRLGGGHKEQSKLYREISNVRLLTTQGSVAYFLPEQAKDEGESEDEAIHNMHADTVINGAVVFAFLNQPKNSIFGPMPSCGPSWEHKKPGLFRAGLYKKSPSPFGLGSAEEATMPPPQVAP